MRFFLYTYASRTNYDTSVRMGVFGAPRDKSGLATKVKKLNRGDLIVIRNGHQSRPLVWFGACLVVGDVFDQANASPFRDLLWADEEARGSVVYPLRVAVDFVGIPAMDLGRATWRSLDQLNFRTSSGRSLVGRQAWGKKLMGNYLDHGRETRAFGELIKLGMS